MKQYGPQGVFYKLSKMCFRINWSDFTFEVCPYKKVNQIKDVICHIITLYFHFQIRITITLN